MAAAEHERVVQEFEAGKAAELALRGLVGNLDLPDAVGNYGPNLHHVSLHLLEGSEFVLILLGLPSELVLLLPHVVCLTFEMVSFLFEA